MLKRDCSYEASGEVLLRAGTSGANGSAMRMRSRLFLALVFTVVLTFIKAHAAETGISELPFEYREGLIWIKVKVAQSREPLNMLLDSGANVSVIDLPTARKLHLKIGRPVTVDGVDSATTGFWPEHLSASAASIRLPKEFLAVDLSTLSHGSQCNIDGLLGADFFAEHAVRIDFARRKVHLDPVSPPAGQQVEIPLRINQGALQVPLSVNNSQQQWVRLDTGCNSALHWVSASAPSGKATSQVAVALASVSIPVTETTVQIGQFAFDHVPTGLHSAEIFAGEAGLLGNGLLSRFDAVTVDLRSKRLILQKNP